MSTSRYEIPTVCRRAERTGKVRSQPWFRAPSRPFLENLIEDAATLMLADVTLAGAVLRGRAAGGGAERLPGLRPGHAPAARARGLPQDHRESFVCNVPRLSQAQRAF